MAAMRYPGLDMLAEVRTVLENGGAGPTEAELGRLIDRLDEAQARGLPFRRVGEATAAFFTLLQDAIERQDPAELPDGLVTRALAAAARGWADAIPLAPQGSRRAAWTILDILHANRVHRALAANAEAEAEAFLAASPCPAPRTALALVARRAELILRDDRVVGWLAHAARSTDEWDLAAVEGWRSRVEIRYLEARAQAGPRAQEILAALWELHEQITEVLGGEFVVQDTPRNARDQAELRETARLMTERILALAAQVDNRDPLQEALLQYLTARIEAGTGAVQSASRILDRLAERGFALHDTALLRARLALLKRYPEDARAVIEDAARRIPVAQGDGPVAADLFRTYRDAGGDPATLGLAELPDRFATWAASNRAAEDEAFVAAIEPSEARARARYWASRQDRLATYLGRLLPAEDFVAALTGQAGRRLEFDEDEAAAVGLDENPALDSLDRDLFLRALEGPVPSGRVAAEALRWIDRMEEAGTPFDTVAARFPGWARCAEVAVRRASTLPVGHRDAWVSLLDGYERLEPPPDDAVIAVMERGLDVLCDGEGWRDALARAWRTWVRARGPLVPRAAVLVRRILLARLRDRRVAAEWPELVARLLDTRPDEAQYRSLADWLESDEEGFRSEVGLRVGWLLANRLPPPHQERARTWATLRLERALASVRNGTEAVALLAAAGDTSAARQAPADWFDRWDAPRPVRLEVGTALVAAMAGPAREWVRARLRTLLFEEFKSAPPRRQSEILRQIETLFPDDRELSALIRDHHEDERHLVARVVLLVLAGLVACGLLWFLAAGR